VAKPRTIHSSILADLATQLRFAPPAAVRRVIERAETMSAQIEPGGLYPASSILSQLTGYAAESSRASSSSRPKPASESESDSQIPGQALLADLGPFVELLCPAAAYGPGECAAPQFVTIAQLCTERSVTRRSVERYRKQGLISRRIRQPGGRGKAAWQIVVRRDVLDLFLQIRARTEAHGPGKGSDTSSKSRTRPQWRRELAFRALRLGISPLKVAARRRGTALVRQGVRAVQRDALMYMLSALREALTPEHAQPARAARCPLSVPGQSFDSPAVLAGLGAPVPRSLAQLLAALGPKGAPSVLPDAAEQRDRALAARALIGRSVLSLRTARRTPQLGDSVATDLRWACRLRSAIAAGHLMLLSDAVRAITGSHLSDLPAEVAEPLSHAGMLALAQAATTWDASRGGGFASPAGLVLNRVLSKLWMENRARVAAIAGGVRGTRAVLIRPAPPPAPQWHDWSMAMYRWQDLIELPAHLAPHLRRAVSSDARGVRQVASRARLQLLAAYHGIAADASGTWHPKAASQLAAERSVAGAKTNTRSHIARTLSAAYAELLALHRQSDTSPR